MSKQRFENGQPVEVLIYDPGLGRSTWNTGFVVTDIVQAFDDKPFRVSVNDGHRFYADAAPECVRAAQAVTA